MSSEKTKWMLQVNSDLFLGIRTPIPYNKIQVISGNFESDVVLRELLKHKTKITISWIPTIEENKEEGGEDNKFLIPVVDIESKTEDVKINGTEYTESYPIKSGVCIIIIDGFELLLGLNDEIDDYLTGEVKKDGDEVKGEMESEEDDNEKSKITTFIKIIMLAIIVIILIIVGIYYKTNFSDEKLSVDIAQGEFTPDYEKPMEPDEKYIKNYIDEILKYYPEQILKSEYQKENNTMHFSGYSLNFEKLERLKKNLESDSSVNFTFNVSTLAEISDIINDRLSKTSYGSITFIYIKENVLECFTSSSVSELVNITQEVNRISEFHGYEKKISCKELHFSKENISFVSYGDHPYVMMKDDSVHFENSEFVNGLTLSKISENKLTFRYKDRYFVLNLK